MKTLDEVICDSCGYWRDYRDDIADHPDYDGHCWLKGIMTLNIKECRERYSHLTVKNGKIEIEYEDAG